MFVNYHNSSSEQTKDPQPFHYIKAIDSIILSRQQLRENGVLRFHFLHDGWRSVELDVNAMHSLSVMGTVMMSKCCLDFLWSYVIFKAGMTYPDACLVSSLCRSSICDVYVTARVVVGE